MLGGPGFRKEARIFLRALHALRILPHLRQELMKKRLLPIRHFATIGTLPIDQTRKILAGVPTDGKTMHGMQARLPRGNGRLPQLSRSELYADSIGAAHSPRRV
jgi:hypothetical protein